MSYTGGQGRKRTLLGAVVVAATLLAAGAATGFELSVVDPQGNPVSGFRWLLEEDPTLWVNPGEVVSDSIGVNIHRSYAPVMGSGASAGSTATVAVPDPLQRYFVSVLPDTAGTMTGHTNGGAPVPPGATSVTVVVNPLPIPTSQISIFVFEDHNSINNAADFGAETPLEGFKVNIFDLGGQVSQDAFGSPLGTEYLRNPDGTFQLDPDGMPIADPTQIGNGFVLSGEDGWAYIKYLAPNKYGVKVTPPTTDPLGNPVNWVQTSTIEGTKVIDAWVKANEARLFVEGFGTASAHTLFGFVNPATLPWVGGGPGGASITGRVVNNHFSAPPITQGYFTGHPVPDCWVGLNTTTAEGLIAVPCNADSTFSIDGVPPGNYQLVTWDTPLDQLFGFNLITVPEGAGTVDLGDIVSFNWFAGLDGKVFNDLDEDGFPDEGEEGLMEQAVNLRFRDGRLYMGTVSQPDGSYSLPEIFPFFKWLVVEVDFATRKATGATIAVDAGGPVLPADGWNYPSFGKLTPQEQAETNPHTNNNLSRTETGMVLTEAIQVYLGQVNVIDWGKAHYAEGENGGISGIVFNTVTRAENDPRMAAGEPWETGIPRAQVALYQDFTGPLGRADGVVDDLDDDGGPTYADVDNHPLGWADGGTFDVGIDVDHNGNGTWDPGDAVNVTWSDSWDDNMPTGCIQHIPYIHGSPARECYDNFGTWNQIRPGVFDGGYAFTSYFPGGMFTGSAEVDGLPSGVYIVESAAPPFYQHQQEEDKNVDFGETYTPSLKAAEGKGGEPELLPPPCVGDLQTVPAYLTLFPDQMIEAPFAGTERPGCDRKQVTLVSGQNAAAEFFLLTEVPKLAQVMGFVLNDLTAEFNVDTPNFGEKAGLSWIPISFKDWDGNEVSRVYTDEWGVYNAALPSSYTINVLSPSGVSPTMLAVHLNDPMMEDPSTGALVPDPFFDPDFSQSVWTFNFTPGAVTYLDTPIVPVGAFVGYPNRNLDVEPPTLSPGIASVDGDLAGGGPAVCAAGATIAITSIGLKQVPNPDFDPDVVGSPTVITRDYGFGATQGRVTVGGVDLPVTGWSDSTITATVPGGTATGQLLVQRGDNLAWSETGLTLHVGVCTATHVTAGMSIQAAIDAADPGDLILVGPGTYNENPIMWKPVLLQGSGAESTRIFATPVPIDRLQAWHDKVLDILGNDPFAANEAPGFMVFGDVVPFTGVPSLIDGFSITGSISGGGIYVWNAAHGLEISNNVVRSNQGSWGGGITAGIFDIVTSSEDLFIHHNRVVKNGGIQGGGGVSLYGGCTGYRVTDNFISGNLTREYGGGILHYGLSDNGLIARNTIQFNEVMFGGQAGGDGGGIFVGGFRAGAGVLADGSGSVTVDSNIIVGNLAGSGSGGGIRLFEVNAADVTLPPSSWYSVTVVNNIIANNVAAVSGGGLSLLDVARAYILNNTIVNNDSVATGANAFLPGVLDVSIPQIAGVATGVHSTQLQALLPVGEPVYADPVLANNIIWQNRSFSWDASLNSFKGGLAPRTPSPYWDLGVDSVDPTHVLHPMSSVLTDPTGYDPSNVTGDPLFQATHLNDLVTAVVMDEGGNRISARFTPLVVGVNEYLLDTALAISSSAFGRGDGAFIATIPELAWDLQGEARSAFSMEAGADEIQDVFGDVDCNGVFDGLDVVQVVNVIYGGASVCNREDYNLDGVVDAADLAAVVAAAW